MEIANEFESLEEDAESPLETLSNSSSYTDDSESHNELLSAPDAELAAAAASAAAASAAALTRAKRSKRKKDFDTSPSDIVQGMPMLQPTPLLGNPAAFSSPPRLLATNGQPGNVVKELMTSAAEIPNPVPQARGVPRGTAASSIAPSTAAAKNALTQRLIEMVKKTASQQGSAGLPSQSAVMTAAAAVVDAASTFEDQGRVSSRGRKRKAKATASIVDGEDDQITYDHEDDINVQPSGAVVVRHHYIPVQSDGSTKTGASMSSKMAASARAILDDPRFEELDGDDTEDEDDDAYDYSDSGSLIARPVPRVAPAAGVVAPGASSRVPGSPTVMGAPAAGTKRGTGPASSSAASRVSPAAGGTAPAAKVGSAAQAASAKGAVAPASARKTPSNFRTPATHNATHHHHHSAAHQQYVLSRAALWPQSC